MWTVVKQLEDPEERCHRLMAAYDGAIEQLEAARPVPYWDGYCGLVKVQDEDLVRPESQQQHTAHPPHAQQQQQQQQPAAGSTEQQQAKVRNYPDEPRVGVGIVVLRQLPPANTPEVLLIRRTKEPSKGMWCFPGGSLELGESLVECAVRETLEETGIHLRNAPREGEIFSDALDFPSPVSSSDAMIRDEQGRLMYHYAIINLAAAPEDPHQPPVPSDDVDAAEWFPVAQLRGLKDLVVHCDQVAERAWQQYTPRS